MGLEHSLNKRVRSDTTAAEQAKERGMKQGNPNSGVYRPDEDVGETKRNQPFVLPPYKHVKKPREPLAKKPKQELEKPKGPYDAPKPDPVEYQNDLDRKFP
jgi:hypothetical protein